MKETTVGDAGRIVRRVYDLLYDRYGPQGWWPAKTKLEVVLGAILVQSTAWGNAAKALDAIREAGVFGEYHALLVALGKDVCRKSPLCLGCALKQVCEYGRRK